MASKIRDGEDGDRLRNPAVDALYTSSASYIRPNFKVEYVRWFQKIVRFENLSDW